MTYSALDIANYMIEYSNGVGKPISNLKLQKYLYFAQAKNLVNTNNPLFESKISKWQYGPVVQSVYDRFKIYQGNSIDRPSDSFKLIKDSNNVITKVIPIQFNSSNIEKEVQKSIQDLIDKLGVYSAFDLVDKTHEHSIWKIDEERINNREHIFYTDNEIKTFFLENSNQQIWK